MTGSDFYARDEMNATPLRAHAAMCAFGIEKLDNHCTRHRSAVFCLHRQLKRNFRSHLSETSPGDDAFPTIHRRQPAQGFR
jgi:hypothetical protein